MSILLIIFGITFYIVIAALLKVSFFNDKDIIEQMGKNKTKKIFVVLIAITWPISFPILLIVGSISHLLEGVE